jgi:hypothetical protein
VVASSLNKITLEFLTVHDVLTFHFYLWMRN